MERIFNRNATSAMNKWFFNTNPGKKLEVVYEEIKNNEGEQFDYVSQCGAVEKVKNIIVAAESKLKSHVLRRLLKNALNEKVKESVTSGSSDKT